MSRNTCGKLALSGQTSEFLLRPLTPQFLPRTPWVRFGSQQSCYDMAANLKVSRITLLVQQNFHPKLRGHAVSDYDFQQLNDKEFEVFCADILGAAHGHRIERFKPGKDFGVDGRYFSNSGSEVLLQCKHWSKTPIRQLIRALQSVEKPKLDKLKPKRYLLAVSNPLSRSDKKEIASVLSPHILSESDVYGREDLNDLLKTYPAVERGHYKLWLHSAAVIGHIFNSALIGRSQHCLEEIVKASRIYVITSNHESALRILERLGVVIISGEPGVGKTTLANHLCLKYVAEGFEFYKISDEIKEAESVFNSESKQIFYFDDFLGRNYLDALRGHEGNQVTQFISRVSSNKNKRFVLTSRSTILNQGKFLIDCFEHDNLRRNEFELKIKSLSEIDKAKILYSHIFHSGMKDEYVEQLYLDRRYRHVISHRNFNPRLINYITDPKRLEMCPANSYWQHLLSSLNDPAQIWDNPFTAQLDDYGRALVLLVVLHGYAIRETELAEAYQRYLSLPSNQGMQGRREYLTSLRLLTGSFTNRTLSPSGAPMIDLFSPSIGDYVLRRYSCDAASIQTSMQCLRTTMSLFTLMGLKREKHLSEIQTQSICSELLKFACAESFDSFSSLYISKLVTTYIELFGDSARNEPRLLSAIRHITSFGDGDASYDSFVSLKWAVEAGGISIQDAVAFVRTHYESAGSDHEIKAISEIFGIIPEGNQDYEEVVDLVRTHVFGIAHDSFEEFVETEIAFSRVSYGDCSAATRELECLLEKKFDDLGIGYTQADISNLVDSYDVESELKKYHENYHEDDERRIDGPQALAINEIDDLFDRG